MAMQLGPRRGVVVDLTAELSSGRAPLDAAELDAFETLNLLYRTLCAIMYNYVPTSGHPGGSISSGRIAAALLFDAMAYDLSAPDHAGADILSYAAGHKALGLYAMWALRNEIARLAAPELLPAVEQQLRLEDLLGFRRNPGTSTPLFLQLAAKPLDGHPTPATPFVRLATGASGVGVASSLGLALAAIDAWGEPVPRVHVVEGEGGLTPGRVSEALAAAGTASIGNLVLHIDWNQASIDSDRVCRRGTQAGDYVQWTPAELCALHDWNVIQVKDGMDLQQVVAAQRRAAGIDNGQPTAIVYETTKGWRYGIEGRASHGAGHAMCSPGFYHALAPLFGQAAAAPGDARPLQGGAAATHNAAPALPTCKQGESGCQGGRDATMVEGCYFQALSALRAALAQRRPAVDILAQRLLRARERLATVARRPRHAEMDVQRIFSLAAAAPRSAPPAEVAVQPGATTTLRDELGRVLGYYNRESGGAVFAAAADLLGSTSTTRVAQSFASGFFNARTNPEARLFAAGGICEDAMAGMLSGLAAYGHHLGVGSSYAAFLGPLGQMPARLHAIACQARQAQAPGEPYRPFVLVCAHAGLKTGEDGPTHADPQALQVLQESFPPGTMLTLTPWDSAGAVAAAGGGAGGAAGGHRRLRHPPGRAGARPLGARPGAARGVCERRLQAASRRGHGGRGRHPAGQRGRLRLRA